MGDSDRGDDGGVFKDLKTRFQNKLVQVQMPSGKIYGPYTRNEVLDFIESRRIRGEEKILFDGETQWKPIASDPQFFDAIHALLSGQEIKRPAIPQEEERKSFSNNDEATQLSRDNTKTEVIGPFNNKDDKTKRSEIVKESPLPDHRQTEPPPLETSFNIVTAPQNGPSLEVAKGHNKKRKLYTLVAALVLVLIVLAIQNTGSKNNVDGDDVYSKLSNASAAKNYSRPLVDALKGFSLNSIRIPQDLKREPLKKYYKFTLNARVTIDRIKKVIDDPNNIENKNAAFWQQLSIDLYLLSLRVQVLDVSAGKLVQDKANSLIEQLKGLELWAEEEQLLFDLLKAHATGDWEKIISEAAFSSYPIAEWLKADANWWKSWSEAKFRKTSPVSEGYLSADLEVVSKVRTSFLEDEPEIATWLLQLASVDAESPYLWFSSAQINWRKSRNVRVDEAYRDFMIGIGALSLYPPSVQLAVWEQFAEFLKSYARAETYRLAQNNFELLSGGNIGLNVNISQWWDLQDAGLDVQSVGKEILLRSSKGVLNARDRAALLVLGQALERGEEFLFVVGTHYCFEEQWEEAEDIFNEMISRDPNSKNGYFGKIWALSKQFRFIEAQEVYSQLQKISAGDLSHLRSKGLIYYLGREYEESHKTFENYLKQSPNDVWALYFSAKSFYDQGNFLECVKSANLAKVQGRGELGFRSELLFFACRIRANINLKETLDQLKQLTRDSPDSLPLRILFVEMMNESGFHNEAIRILDESLKYFPFSAKLNIAAGKLYDGQGVLGKSMDYYFQATRLAPNMAEPWVRMAKVLENQDKYLEAAQNYETAARIQPAYPEIYLFAARAFVKANKISEAAVYYEKEIEARPEAMSTFVEAAEFFLKNNNPQQVPALYRKFHGAFQDDPRALVRLAQAYNVMGDLANAKSFASRAVAGDPDNPYVNLILANILDRAGDYQLAKRYYQLYMQLNPQAPDEEELNERLSKPPYSN